MHRQRMGSGLKAAMTGLAAGLLALAALPAAAETQVPLATWGGANHVGVREFVASMERALKELEPHTIKFQHYPGGQLGQDKDMPMAIPTGQAKFAWITVNGWSGIVNDTKVMDAPTGLTMKELDAVIEQPNGLMSVLKKRFAEKNTTLLALADLGPPAVVSREPIRTPADFKGKKVRVFSEGQAEAVKAFGGAPVTIAFAEVYTAMQHGTIDAAIIGFQGVDSQKMHEVAKHVLVPASFLGTTMMGWAANPQWLNSMPAKDREVFLKAVRKAELENRQAIVKEIDELTKLYKERGLTVTFLSPDMKEYAAWRDATKPLMERARKELSPDVVALIAKQG
ncbi:MAG TPA: TRAP transporter substrate-binding protein [Azospirillum sp.]|nr:TRAP transporter substrate-binding protein [Azospirillum sp.]